MQLKKFKKNFLSFCKINKMQVHINQIKTVDILIKLYSHNIFSNFSLTKIFSKKDKKLGFYLSGDVGVGKTMILNLFYDNLEIPKLRMHFNEFMINFHDFAYNNKVKNSLENFVKDLKNKYKILYFDEFQVTNIVDAMILGKLFEKIFKNNIKVIFTSNTKINDLYKDGLQREQFLPFIKIINNFCLQHELIIDEDYREKSKKVKRSFFPINEETSFKINQLFRKLTKEKKQETKTLNVKGRLITINNYYDKIARFHFKELCDQSFGAEDYINIAKICNLMVIENIPQFNDENMNQQHRFITLIDVLYEKKIPLITSSFSNFKNMGSSRKLVLPFKRTISRLFELTSSNFY